MMRGAKSSPVDLKTRTAGQLRYDDACFPVEQLRNISRDAVADLIRANEGHPYWDIQVAPNEPDGSNHNRVSRIDASHTWHCGVSRGTGANFQ